MLYKFCKFSKSCIEIVFLLFIIFGCHKNSIEELDVVNVSNTSGRSEHPAIAADSRGYFHVVWDDNFANQESLVVYMVTRSLDGEWSAPDKIFEPRAAQFPDIEVDNFNTIHLIWRDTDPQGWGEVLYTKKPLGSNWTNPDTISIYGMSATPGLTLDGDGNVHIVWKELVGSWPIFYVRKIDDMWSMPVEISKGNVFGRYNLQFTVDPTAYAHVVWEEQATDTAPNLVVYTTNTVGDTFSYPEAIYCFGTSFERQNTPSIVVDNEGTIHVVWSEYGDIFYTFKKSSDMQWRIPARVRASSAYSAYPNLVVDTDGALHLIWEEGYADIYYTSKFEDSDWTEPEICIINTIGGFCGAKIAVSLNSIGLVFNGYILPPTGEDNYEVFFAEIPKN